MTPLADIENFHCQYDEGEAESCYGCREPNCSLRFIPLELDDLIDRLKAESQSDLPPERRNDPNRLELVEAVGMLGEMLNIHYNLDAVDEIPASSDALIERDYENERWKLKEFIALLQTRLERHFEEQGRL